jgi:hypothetical protein
MTDESLAQEITQRFEEMGNPSHWIKPFSKLRTAIQCELLAGTNLGPGEIPLFGGSWREARKKSGALLKERVHLLVTTRRAQWSVGSARWSFPPENIMNIEDSSPENRHFAARGYFGLRRFTLELDDRSRIELPSKGGGAASSVWMALALLCIRRREATTL